MAFHENLNTFKGLPVKDWSADDAAADYAKVVFRIRLGYDEAEEGLSIVEKLAGLLDSTQTQKIVSIIIGGWQGDDTGHDSSDIVEALAAAGQKLPRLRNLFVGDIIGEECECSWIRQSDLSPLLNAYENLEHLTVRGGEGLSFGALQHAHLKELIVQTGGLPASVVHEIGAAKLPVLEHLELWLGEPNYGGDATVDDLAPLLRGDGFANLRYLGLKNSEIEDDIAGVAALAPILRQIETLDLSLGTLGDAGASALLASPAIRGLKKLDLHHHFISDAIQKRFSSLGIAVDLSDPCETHEWGGEEHRYISVSE